MSDTTLLAIDPVGCGCTECLIGEYVPLQNATRENILALVKGDLRNNTYGFTINVEYDTFTVSSREGGANYWEFNFYDDDVDKDDIGVIINRLVWDL